MLQQVKVMADTGFGNVSDIISGLDYVRQVAPTSGKPSVVSMSIGGPVTEALDQVSNFHPSDCS